MDDRRRSIVKPADETIDVPIVIKKNAQVLAIVGNNAQLMDLTTYEVFELVIPEEIKEKVKPGEEVVYFEVVGMKTLKPIK